MLETRGTSSSSHVRSGFLLLLTSAVTMILAASSAASPRGDTGLTAIPEECTYVTASALPEKRTILGGPNVDVCGSFHDDEFKIKRGSGGGTTIWGGPGRDQIDDQNGAVNLILAGDRRDTVKIDVCKGLGGVQDTVDGAVAKVTKVTARCPGVKPSGRTLSQRAVVYPRFAPSVWCGLDVDDQRFVQIADPIVRAVDATRNVDFQKVAFRALLYKQEDGAKKLDQVSIWLWDRTFDEQIEAFPGNYWRKFKGDTRTRWFVWFAPAEPGIYEVRFQFRWFAANRLKTHDETDVAFDHLGPFQNRDQTACDFPGPSLPGGTYTGQTDEQQSVVLEVEPMYDDAPSLVAWSEITSFAFTTSVECTPALPVADARWRIDATDLFDIPIHSDGTFSATHSGPIPGISGRQNVTGTYLVGGRIDRSGTAAGTVRLSDISYLAGGVRYSCTGRSHAWTAARAP